MRLNNKGMSIVEVVLTFALIMIISTGLLMIVVNYRNKVSVSSQRLIMDSLKNNTTQDIYNDMLKYGLKEINEYSDVDLENVAENVKMELRDVPTYNALPQATFDSQFNQALDMVKADLLNLTVKSYPGTDNKNTFAQALITKFQEKFGECLTIKKEAKGHLNRCINITFQDSSVASKAFGTSYIDDSDKDSIENKYLYYDGIKYAISDKMPSKMPKDANGNDRPYKDLQRVEVNDDGILTVEDTILEDGTKVSIYKIDVRVYHVDFREDFGLHIVMSTDDISI